MDNFINIVYLFACMGLLNDRFSEAEDFVKNIDISESDILNHWTKYISTLSRKNDLISDPVSNLSELKELLSLELVEISNDEKKESELLSELESVEHSKNVERIHKLKFYLGNEKSMYSFVYHLLKELYQILKYQMNIIVLLESKITDKLITNLKLQSELEQKIIAEIKKIKTFDERYLAIIKKKHDDVIVVIKSREKRLIKKMKSGVSKIFSEEINSGIVYEWAMTVFEEVENFVCDHDALIENGYEPNPDSGLEFVNSSDFLKLAREVIFGIRSRLVSDRMINAFVFMFREWYNDRD
jgi:hypothetical protein